jgi:hypothetical protein
MRSTWQLWKHLPESLLTVLLSVLFGVLVSASRNTKENGVMVTSVQYCSWRELGPAGEPLQEVENSWGVCT